MTPQEARLYYLKNLPDCASASDLLRLTLWLLPHLPCATPLGCISDVQFEIKLSYARTSRDFQVRYACNQDLSEQLRVLGPVYCVGSQGCMQAAPWLSFSGGPRQDAPGFSLGVFASEHMEARQALAGATSIEQWWRMYMNLAPLWLRTAYNWERPTPAQQHVLEQARNAMLGHASALAQHTAMRCHNGRVQMWVKPLHAGSAALKAPHWTAFMAGQHLVRIDRFENEGLQVDGWQLAAPGVMAAVEEAATLAALVRNKMDFDHRELEHALAEVSQSRAMGLNQDTFDIGGMGLDIEGGAPTAFRAHAPVLQ